MVIPLSSQVWRDARALISHEGVGMGMRLFVRAKKDESMCQHKKPHNKSLFQQWPRKEKWTEAEGGGVQRSDVDRSVLQFLFYYDGSKNGN